MGKGDRGIFEALCKMMRTSKAQTQLARKATKAAEEPGGPPPDKTQEGGSNGTVSCETQLAAAYSERCGNLSALAAQVYFCFLPSPLYLPSSSQHWTLAEMGMWAPNQPSQNHATSRPPSCGAFGINPGLRSGSGDGREGAKVC